jgi:hypothetical protein
VRPLAAVLGGVRHLARSGTTWAERDGVGGARPLAAAPDGGEAGSTGGKAGSGSHGADLAAAHRRAGQLPVNGLGWPVHGLSIFFI